MISRLSILATVTISVGFISLSGVAKASETAWGAMAIDSADSSTSPIYGVGGGDTEQEATDNAMKFCTEGGGKECMKIMTYQGCGAIASAGDGKGHWASASTKKDAESAALKGCEGAQCTILASDCN